jgi:hypothetical protein
METVSLKTPQLRGTWGALSPWLRFGVVVWGLCALLLVEWVLEIKLTTAARRTLRFQRR